MLKMQGEANQGGPKCTVSTAGVAPNAGQTPPSLTPRLDQTWWGSLAEFYPAFGAGLAGFTRHVEQTRGRLPSGLRLHGMLWNGGLAWAPSGGAPAKWWALCPPFSLGPLSGGPGCLADQAM